MIDQTKIFSQMDPTWASKPLGSSGVDMYHGGCFSCEVTHQLRRYGHDIDPGQLNDLLNQYDGYDRDGLLIWWVVEQLFPDVELVSYWNTTLHPASGLKLQIDVAIKAIRKAVQLGMVTGLCVDVPSVNFPGEPDHIVADDIVTADLIGWSVKDSDGGTRQILGGAKYKSPDKSIYGFRLLVGSPVYFPPEATEYERSLGNALYVASQAHKRAVKVGDAQLKMWTQEIINKLIGL